jgi:hypothetical protein
MPTRPLAPGSRPSGMQSTCDSGIYQSSVEGWPTLQGASARLGGKPPCRPGGRPSLLSMGSPRIVRCCTTSPAIIRLALIMHVRYPRSWRTVEDLLCAPGIDIRHETVRFWWNRFGAIFATEIRRSRVQAMRSCPASRLAPRRDACHDQEGATLFCGHLIMRARCSNASSRSAATGRQRRKS